MNASKTRENGFSQEVIDSFRNGIPENWRDVIMQHYVAPSSISAESSMKPIESPKEIETKVDEKEGVNRVDEKEAVNRVDEKEVVNKVESKPSEAPNESEPKIEEDKKEEEEKEKEEVSNPTEPKPKQGAKKRKGSEFRPPRMVVLDAPVEKVCIDEELHVPVRRSSRHHQPPLPFWENSYMIYNERLGRSEVVIGPNSHVDMVDGRSSEREKHTKVEVQDDEDDEDEDVDVMGDDDVDESVDEDDSLIELKPKSKSSHPHPKSKSKSKSKPSSTSKSNPSGVQVSNSVQKKIRNTTSKSVSNTSTKTTSLSKSKSQMPRSKTVNKKAPPKELNVGFPFLVKPSGARKILTFFEKQFH